MGGSVWQLRDRQRGVTLRDLLRVETETAHGFKHVSEGSGRAVAGVPFTSRFVA